MTEDDFWDVIAVARAATGGNDDTQNEAIADAITDVLAARDTDEIVAYQAHFDRASSALYRWDVWGAAYLINGGCSDDAFDDFRAGVIVLGRQWYERVRDEPDSLAIYPSVVGAAEIGYDGAILAELVLYAASEAYERLTGSDEGFYADPRLAESTDTDNDAMGEDWDFDDDEETRRRLPKLAALFLDD